MSGTTISAGNNILMDAGDNLRLIASDLDANNIGLTAFNDVLIASGEESRLRESRSQSGGLFSGGSLYAITESINGSASTTANSTTVNATGNIVIDAGSATVIGSTLNADESISVSTDIGDIQVLAAEEATQTYSHDKSMGASVW